MQTAAEENTSMCERILTDIQHIFNGDHNLKEFTIVPISQSRNKSPVLYEEHCLGLESWCVKHVYHYIYRELFRFKPFLKKGRLVQQKLEQINKLLISALLLHPDVTTFWNIRRELIEKGAIQIEKELVLTKLVLSHKSKSNECFAYRKWIINKLAKNIMNYDFMLLLNSEFDVTEMAAEKSANNYHAWSHRIWCINIMTKTEYVDSVSFLSTVLSELDFSNNWINKHISEHAGFHYRQYLCQSILKNGVISTVPNIKYHCLIEPFIGIKFSNCDNVAYLNNLLGKHEVNNSANHHTLLKSYNYVYYFTILLSDLFYYIEQLNETFPGHEALWCHRRFVVFSLLKGAYDYHGLIWKHTCTLNHLNTIHSDFNIITTNVNSVCGTGEKSAKLLKYDIDKVESSYLYKLIIESEIKFIKENTSDKSNDCVQNELALRHGKWLRLVLGLSKISV